MAIVSEHRKGEAIAIFAEYIGEYNGLYLNNGIFDYEFFVRIALECVFKSINPSEKRRNMQIWRKTKRETGSQCRISLTLNVKVVVRKSEKFFYHSGCQILLRTWPECL